MNFNILRRHVAIVETKTRCFVCLKESIESSCSSVNPFIIFYFRCGIVLIDSQWAMSAAHCFFWSSGGQNMTSLAEFFQVQVGSNERNSAMAQRLGVEEIIVHPDYNSGALGFK